MVYERKIRYLDYLSNGGRIQGGGFVKLEVRNASMRMDLTVMGLYRTDSLECEVLLCGGGQEKSIGRITILNGRGQFWYECHNLEDIGGMGIPYEELRGIRIPLGAGREVSGSWEQRRGTGRGLNAAKEAPAGGVDEMAAEGMEKAPRQEIWEASDGRVQEASDGEIKGMRDGETGQMTGMEMEEASDGVRRKMPGQGIGEASGKDIQASSREVREMSDGTMKEASDRGNMGRRAVATPESIRLLDDKWQQLCALYPHIRPFQDEREYLSIGPADFVLFPSDSYKMVNNSFLLHGYYNYNHLLLARLEKKEEISYYVGAPGNYFEKEKQVAIMFGFESFECAEEPAQPGDFGYYMMRVQL